MLTTAALLTDAGRPFRLERVELEPPRPGELLVRMAGAGICHTDLALAESGPPAGLPAILGHEGSGVVEQVGDGVESVVPGDHVVLSYASCGECSRCDAGKPAYCELAAALNFSGSRPDGSSAVSFEGEPVVAHFFSQSSFAHHAVALERNAVVVPSDLPLELLGPLGCGVQTGAGTVLCALEIGAGQSLAVFGAGTVGLSAVMAAAAVGAEPIVVVEPDPTRRELALELGADAALDSAQEVPRLASAIGAIAPGGVEFSIDTVSSPEVLPHALECLASPGTCATLGLSMEVNEVSLDQRQLLYGRTIRGVIEGEAIPQELIPRLIGLWQEGRLPFDRLIERYPFERINAACDDARAGRVIKPVLTFDEPRPS